MGSRDAQFGANVEGTLNESILIFNVIMDAQVFGDEADLGFGDIAFAAVVEGKLELGEAVEELAGDFVEKDGAFTVELSGYSKSGSLGKRED